MAVVIPPPHLYKYLPPLPGEPPQREYHRLPIADSRIYLAAPSKLNDPFDCAPAWMADVREIDADEFVQLTAARRQGTFVGGIPTAMLDTVKTRALDPEYRQKLFEESAEQFGVHSLSETYDDALMWAHYGHNHQGYCLQYSDLMTLAMDRSEPHLLISPVEYDSKRLLLSSRALLKRIATRSAVTDDDMKWLWHKSKCWEYEREWRLLTSRAESVGRLKPISPRHLVGIIFGYRCNKADEEQLRAWAALHPSPIGFSRMARSTTYFSLERLPA